VHDKGSLDASTSRGDTGHCRCSLLQQLHFHCDMHHHTNSTCRTVAHCRNTFIATLPCCLLWCRQCCHVYSISPPATVLMVSQELVKGWATAAAQLKVQVAVLPSAPPPTAAAAADASGARVAPLQPHLAKQVELLLLLLPLLLLLLVPQLLHYAWGAAA